MLISLKKDESGVILIVILAILALLCLVGITLVTTTRIEQSAALAVASSSQARLACEAALQYVIRDLTNDVSGSDVKKMRDAYGEEPWFFSTGGAGANNFCRTGTGTITSSTVLTSTAAFSTTLDDHKGFILQPDTNNPQTFPIASSAATGNTLTISLVKGLDLTDVGASASGGHDFRVLGAYMWQSGDTLEVDCTGDGMPDAKWITLDIGSARYSARYAVYIDDLSGKLNANMVGNFDSGTSASAEIHTDGAGFDSFDMSLVRAIKGACPSTEIGDPKARQYARAMMIYRVGGATTTNNNTDGYGLTDSLSILGDATGSIGATAETTAGSGYYRCTVTNLSNDKFLGKRGLRLDPDPSGGTTYPIINNTGNTIITKGDPGAVAFTIRLLAKFDPGDSSGYITSWTPYDERDAMEIRESSPHASVLEQAVVYSGHDTGDNDSDGTADQDYDTPSDGIDRDGDGTANDSDEDYCRFEEWDMIRPHLTTYAPSTVSAANGYSQDGTTTLVNLNTAIGSAIETMLGAAGMGDDVTRDQFVANILAWRDEDSTISSSDGGFTYGGCYGIEPHLVISEIAWTSVAGGPDADDTYVIELYNPWSVSITIDSTDANYYELGIPGATGTPFNLRTVAGSDQTIAPGGVITFGTAAPAANVNADMDFYTGVAWQTITLRRKASPSGALITVDQAGYTGAPPADGSSVSRVAPFKDSWSAPGKTLGTANATAQAYFMTVQNRYFATPGEISKVFSVANPGDVSGADLCYPGDFGSEGAKTVRVSDSVIANVMDRSTVHDPTDNNTKDTRWHGRINVNTASRAALMSLPCMGAFPDNGRQLADCIMRNRPYDNFEELVAWLDDNSWSKAFNDGFDNDGDGYRDNDANEGDDGHPETEGNISYLASDGVDNDLDGYIDETDEAVEYFLSSIANLITFRSDLFEVIVRAEVVDNNRGVTVGQAQMRAVVDRSTVGTGTGVKVISRRWE